VVENLTYAIFIGSFRLQLVAMHSGAVLILSHAVACIYNI